MEKQWTTPGWPDGPRPTGDAGSRGIGPFDWEKSYVWREDVGIEGYGG